MNSELDGLQTLQRPDATVPETRFRDARAVQDYVRNLVNADLKRAWKRSQVQGLVDGNPPFKIQRLKALGRLDVSNCNFMSADSFVEQACGIFFDLFSESPTNFIIRTGFGNVDDKETWSRKITQIAHDTLNDDPRWNFIFQTSQRFMVLHGTGPMYFESPNSVMPRWIPSGDLKVDDMAESETAYWEMCAILQSYKPHELYDRIKDPVSAHKAGWNVDATRTAIMNAQPLKTGTTIMKDWSFYQAQYKHNSMWSLDLQNVIRVAWVFWKEFDGTITLALVEQEAAGSNITRDTTTAKDNEPVKYLYFFKSRFKNFKACIHPLFADRGNGTTHSVTGMGSKMFGAMSLENRLRNSLADKAFAPKLIFKPQSASHPEFSLTALGDFGTVPAGWDMQQITTNGQMQDGMVFLNEIGRTLSTNLAQYRQNSKTGGNPPTLGQVQIEQAQQFRVANTQVSRYYRQLDSLYDEIIRRLTDSKNSDPLAAEFRKRCKEQDVPKEAYGNIESVEAYRVAGQGSSVLRQSALERLLAISGSFPEEGQVAVKRDFIASQVGQRGVDRYYPQREGGTTGTGQEANAMLQVASMKVGIAPVIAGEQDATVFASTFLGAAGQALGTISQGANPMDVLKFVDMAAPAAHAHMQRMSADPQKAGLLKEMTKMFNQVATLTDQIKKRVGEMQQQAAQQKAQAGNGQPQLPPEDMQKLQLEDAKAKLKMQNMMLSHRQRLIQRKEAHDADMQKKLQDAKIQAAAKDLTTVADVRSKQLRALGT